ncbi:MAG: ArsC family reductase [Bdellovibrionales bacterium]
MTTIYGIKNCDTMKKALTWLDERGITYDFVDYKKHGADEAVLKQALHEHGWEAVINRRGTTWRNVPDDIKTTMNTQTAITIATENPSIIKRPLLAHNGKTYLGFDAKTYEGIFIT